MGARANSRVPTTASSEKRRMESPLRMDGILQQYWNVRNRVWKNDFVGRLCGRRMESPEVREKFTTPQAFWIFSGAMKSIGLHKPEIPRPQTGLGMTVN